MTTVSITRNRARAISDLILKTPRELLPLRVDYDILTEFVTAVENTIRLESAIYRSGLRQFGLSSVVSESFNISSETALELANFMEIFKNDRVVS